MRTTKTVAIPLDNEDYERLAAEASRVGMSPATLARDYVHAGLAGNGEADVKRMRRTGLEALDRLAELTVDLPPVDAVEVARECREELERRPFPL